MQLNYKEDNLHEHMELAQERVEALVSSDRSNEELQKLQKSFHDRADDAFSVGDVVEHRICCMAANLLNPHWRSN